MISYCKGVWGHKSLWTVSQKTFEQLSQQSWHNSGKKLIKVTRLSCQTIWYRYSTCYCVETADFDFNAKTRANIILIS